MSELELTMMRRVGELNKEVSRLKAEVEELTKPAIIGGYNLSQYIRMANSETLEFDNGDIFADMTLPERIKYIVESNASLRSVAEDNKRECEATRIENARLKAEVERLTEAWVDKKMQEDRDALLQQVERLTKAGDAMAGVIGLPVNSVQSSALIQNWNAAKEGKQP